MPQLAKQPLPFITLRLSRPDGQITDLTITSNQIEADVPPTVPVWVAVTGTATVRNSSSDSDSTAPIGQTARVRNTVIDRNTLWGIDTTDGDTQWTSTPPATRVKRSLWLANATSWRFDLSSSLVFAAVRGSVTYNFVADGGAAPPPVWMASDGRADAVLEVRAARPVSGRVYIVVDQSDQSAAERKVQAPRQYRAVEAEDPQRAHLVGHERALDLLHPFCARQDRVPPLHLGLSEERPRRRAAPNSTHDDGNTNRQPKVGKRRNRLGVGSDSGKFSETT